MTPQAFLDLYPYMVLIIALFAACYMLVSSFVAGLIVLTGNWRGEWMPRIVGSAVMVAAGDLAAIVILAIAKSMLS